VIDGYGQGTTDKEIRDAINEIGAWGKETGKGRTESVTQSGKEAKAQ
jgi:hypothetical protein